MWCFVRRVVYTIQFMSWRSIKRHKTVVLYDPIHRKSSTFCQLLSKRKFKFKFFFFLFPWLYCVHFSLCQCYYQIEHQVMSLHSNRVEPKKWMEKSWEIEMAKWDHVQIVIVCANWEKIQWNFKIEERSYCQTLPF